MQILTISFPCLVFLIGPLTPVRISSVNNNNKQHCVIPFEANEIVCQAQAKSNNLALPYADSAPLRLA